MQFDLNRQVYENCTGNRCCIVAVERCEIFLADMSLVGPFRKFGVRPLLGELQTLSSGVRQLLLTHFCRLLRVEPDPCH